MNWYDFFKHFVSGGVAGASCLIAGHPFDTVKVRLQTMPKPRPGEVSIFTGTIDCFQKTASKEGFLALFKGMAVPVLLATPRAAIFFGSCELGRKLQSSGPDTELTALQNFNAGAFASLIRAAVMVPTERIKCLLQVQQFNRSITGSPHYRGPTDVVKNLYRQGGIRSIYTGTAATLLRDLPSGGIYLATYGYFKNLLSGNERRRTASPWAIVMAGGLAGLTSCSVVMPADVIKSRLQTAPAGKYKNGTRSVVYQLLREEGATAFFKGLTPVMLRAFPANAVCFLALETSLSLFQFIEVKAKYSAALRNV